MRSTELLLYQQTATHTKKITMVLHQKLQTLQFHCTNPTQEDRSNLHLNNNGNNLPAGGSNAMLLLG